MATVGLKDGRGDARFERALQAFADSLPARFKPKVWASRTSSLVDFPISSPDHLHFALSFDAERCSIFYNRGQLADYPIDTGVDEIIAICRAVSEGRSWSVNRGLFGGRTAYVDLRPFGIDKVLEIANSSFWKWPLFVKGELKKTHPAWANS